LRPILVVLFAAALLGASAHGREARSPCDVVTKAELRAALGGNPIEADPSTIGEATAPSCIWTVRGADARITIEIWSGDELQVVDEKTARDYFTSRLNEALKFGDGVKLEVGEGAFRMGFGGEPIGEIGVMKNRRFLVFAFEHVSYARALKLTKAVVKRL
jgi:hypothetical protein